MKLLILFGSPRKNGNSAALLESFLNNWNHEYDVINAYSTAVKPCIDCRKCWEMERPGCIIKDEMQRIYDLIDRADRLLIVSPVYFYGLPAPLKAIFDRCQCYWAHLRFKNGREVRAGRKIGAILVGGAPPYETQFDGILGGLKHWAGDQRAEIVDVVKFGGSDKRNLTEEPEALEACRDLAQKLL